MNQNHAVSAELAQPEKGLPQSNTTRNNGPSRRKFLGQVGAALAGGAVLGKAAIASGQDYNQAIRDSMPSPAKPPPKDPRWNYLIGIKTKWHRSFFYFIGVYASPGPDALSPTFESGFTRLEYAGPDRFNLAYMPHTENWQEVYPNLSLEEAMAVIRDETLFHPPG